MPRTTASRPETVRFEPRAWTGSAQQGYLCIARFSGKLYYGSSSINKLGAFRRALRQRQRDVAKEVADALATATN